MTASVKRPVKETPELDLDLDKTKRPVVPPSDFRWEGDWLAHVGHARVECSWFTYLRPDLARSLRKHLIKFSAEGKYASTTLLRGVDVLCMSIARHQAREFDKAWLMRSLSSSSFQAVQGFLRAFFIYWQDRYSRAISNEALLLLAKRSAHPKYPRNVLSDDPDESWLTDLEFDALLHQIWANYDHGITCTQVTLLRLLSMQYARRTVQLANLKFGDFREDDAVEAGGTGRWVHFPGAKDRHAEDNFRDSKEEVHPIADHLWDLYQLHKYEVQQLIETVFGFPVNEKELNLLPVFVEQAQLCTAMHELTSHYGIDWRANLGHRIFHTPGQVLGKYLTWAKTTPAHIFARDGQSCLPVPPYSHRTGRPIRVTSTRMRHTRARQLARLGMPKEVLSYWLGHSDARAVEAYYNDPAEESRKINAAMSGALSPLAMSFTGKLLDDKSQASRADDPESAIEFPNGENLTGVGNCGKHSFCATTSVPVPCYRCKHFEPLVFAPHDEVLNALLVRQAEENAMIKIGGNRKLLTPIDLSPDIRAVQACIARCDARKAELGVGE